jgi:tetratricopeptide (TPR) repeat protein
MTDPAAEGAKAAGLEQGNRDFSLGHWAEARQAAETLLARHPDLTDAWLLLANVALRQGTVTDALAILSNAEHNRPDDAVFPFHIACLSRDIGQLELARAAFGRAAGRPNANAEVHYQRARQLQADGDFRHALISFDRAVALEPGHADAAQEAAAVRSIIAETERRLARHAEYLNANERYPVPFVGFTGRPYGRHPSGSRLDGWGFPNRAPPEPGKAPGNQRVFVLGDSTMWRSEESLAATVPALLQDALQGRGYRDVSVHNFSVVSTCATQMLALLFSKLIDYDPDLVIFVCGATDIFIPYSYDPRPGFPYNFYVTEELYTRYFDFDRVDKEGMAFGYADIFHDIAVRQAELRTQAGFGQSSQWELDIIETFRRFLLKLDRVATGFGLNVAVLLQPMANTKTPLNDAEREHSRPEMFDYYQRQYQRYRGLLFPDGVAPRRCSERLTLFDATDVFDGHPELIYTDFIHYDLAGAGLMAERMADIAAGYLSREPG